MTEDAIGSLHLPGIPRGLYEPQRYILNNGGKRIRPVLVLMSCGLCRGDIQKALPAALAVELVHNFTLIHDDIMDQAVSRRGQQAVHVKWDHATAILAGDGMFVQAMFQLYKLPEATDHKKVSRIFLESVNTVCEGQALDIEFEDRLDVTTQDYLEMIRCKTATLISTAMQMGGLVAGAPDNQIQQLMRAGRQLGLAFQIQDDWLDVVADPEKFGKRKGGDIYEGKKTFLMLNTLERCNSTERNRLKELLGSRPLQKKDVDDVIQLYEKYNVTENTRELMMSYYREAGEIIKQFDDSVYKQDLLKLITYLENREQ